MKNPRPGRTFPFSNVQQRHLSRRLFGLRINVMKLLVHLADTEGARGKQHQNKVGVTLPVTHFLFGVEILAKCNRNSRV